MMYKPVKVEVRLGDIGLKDMEKGESGQLWGKPSKDTKDLHVCDLT